MALKHRQQLPQASPLLVPSKVLDLGCWSGVATMSHSWLMPKAQPSVLTFFLNKLALFAPFYLSPVGAYSIILIFGGWGSERLVEYHLPLLYSTVNPEVFIKFLKINIVVPRVISRISQMCFIPHQGLFMCLCFSILLLMALFGGSVGMEDIMANLLLIFR